MKAQCQEWATPNWWLLRDPNHNSFLPKVVAALHKLMQSRTAANNSCTPRWTWRSQAAACTEPSPPRGLLPTVLEGSLHTTKRLHHNQLRTWLTEVSCLQDMQVQWWHRSCGSDQLLADCWFLRPVSWDETDAQRCSYGQEPKTSWVMDVRGNLRLLPC